MSGEESEDQILRRLLCSPNNAPVQAKTRERPYVDPRFGVTFEEGTAIFRTYKGERFEARVEDGQWRLFPGGKYYSSLNSLSAAVSKTPENAWKRWKFIDQENQVREIGFKRKELDMEASNSSEASGPPIIWRDTVHLALENLGGEAALGDIYKEARRIRTERKLSKPPNLEALVRKELELNSPDSEQFQGKHSLFRVSGIKGQGRWRLKK